MTSLDPAQMLEINRLAWGQVAPRFCGATALPSYGPLGPSEDQLRLLTPISGSRVLELGCGSGHSLQYLAERGAAEVWGLDLSPVQLEHADNLLRPFHSRVHLSESPMEIKSGLPTDYFDLVFSIYALGWTTDLLKTVGLVYEYLKPGGCFVFSGEHPVYGCLKRDGELFVFSRTYLPGDPVLQDTWFGVPIVRPNRTLSTFVNDVVGAGLNIEQLIEGDGHATPISEELADPEAWYSIPRARLMPTTFIVKARKSSHR